MCHPCPAREEEAYINNNNNNNNAACKQACAAGFFFFFLRHSPFHGDPAAKTLINERPGDRLSLERKSFANARYYQRSTRGDQNIEGEEEREGCGRMQLSYPFP